MLTRFLIGVVWGCLGLAVVNGDSLAASRLPEREEDCEILVVGGGLAGTATAYEALLAGRTVCLTEITDWLGGQVSAQGTAALDERPTQRSQLFYPRGYLELRQRIEAHYGTLNPGNCWVSESCFLPGDAAAILLQMLRDAAAEGSGELKWFPSTVVKDLAIDRVGRGEQIEGAIAIQHHPASGAPPLNAQTLSQTIEDWYRYDDSSQFEKTIIRFVPATQSKAQPQSPSIGRLKDELTSSPSPRWYVVDASETGELIALADVPYRLGIDARSHLDPSSSSETGDPYCTQGFTYPFAMAAMTTPQPHRLPAFYPRYASYYSYEKAHLADFDLVFSYRRIWSPRNTADPVTRGYITYIPAQPGDISMQNWTWGNDYRPGRAGDNLVYTRNQLLQQGQLNPGGWQGGLRTETLQRAEEQSIGFFYWLVAGTSDSQLGEGVKQLHPNFRYLTGLDSPMGTMHGLSKYPYIREGRRLIGRPGAGYPYGFGVREIDISRRNYRQDYYRKMLPPRLYRQLQIALAGLEAPAAIAGTRPLASITQRTRSSLYPDSVGIAHYAIDFHPCMTLSPPETPGNTERIGERRAEGQAYPFQIPLRAAIPQNIDNLLVAGKSIATSHIAAAAYRIHSFEWSVGAAVGTTAAFSLENAIAPYQLVQRLPSRNLQLEALQQQLRQNGNPTAFPDTSIFNQSWEDWR